MFPGDPFTIEFEEVAPFTADETRYAMIGLTSYGLVYLVYSETTPDELHFITARRAEPWIIDEYEENRKETETSSERAQAQGLRRIPRGH
jgi:uncharacterized DUF497 family protein